jgi:hypothetical protein
LPTIVAPKALAKRLYEWVKGSWAMKIDASKDLPWNYQNAQEEKFDKPFLDVQAGCWVPIQAGETTNLSTANIIKTNGLTPHKWNEIAKGGGKDKLFATAIQCYHTMADVGYVIFEERTRRRLDLQGKTGAEMAALAKAGEKVNEVVSIYHLAYVCDTTVQVFENEASAKLMFQCPTIMIECTFLEKDMEEEAEKRGHVCWTLLEPYVTQHPEIEFILFHFSQRYNKDEMIIEYFNNLFGGQPKNVKLWLDSGVH